MIFGNVFAPEVIAYVTRRVEQAIAELRAVPDERRQLLEAELARARKEVDNIAGAIRQGIVTPQRYGSHDERHSERYGKRSGKEWQWHGEAGQRPGDE